MRINATDIATAAATATATATTACQGNRKCVLPNNCLFGIETFPFI